MARAQVHVGEDRVGDRGDAALDLGPGQATAVADLASGAERGLPERVVTTAADPVDRLGDPVGQLPVLIALQVRSGCPAHDYVVPWAD